MFTGVKLLRNEPERSQPVYGVGKIWYHVVRHDTAPKRSVVQRLSRLYCRQEAGHEVIECNCSLL